jgi:hypothetical protein
MPRYDIKNATVRLKDAGTLTVKIKVDEGTLQWTETRNREYILDGGKLDSVRDGDESPVSVNLDARMEMVVSPEGDIDEVRKFLKGQLEGQISTGQSCEPYACDIEVEFAMPCEGSTTGAATSGTARILTIPEFRYEQKDGDIRTSMLKITGKANVTEPIFEEASND